MPPRRNDLVQARVLPRHRPADSPSPGGRSWRRRGAAAGSATVNRRWRSAGRAVGVSLALLLAILGAATGADESSAVTPNRSPAPGCAWGPVNDAQAVRARLDAWVSAFRLGRIESWDLGIDRGSAEVRLRLAQGALTLAWSLDAECMPVAVTIQATSDFQGPLPDEGAVGRLVASLRAVVVEQRAAPAWAMDTTLLAISFVLLLLGSVRVLSREAVV